MLFNLLAGGFHGFQVRSFHADPHGGANAALKHHDARGNRLQHGSAGSSGKICRTCDGLPNIFRALNSSPGCAAGVENRIEGGAPERKRLSIGVRDQIVRVVPGKTAPHQIGFPVRGFDWNTLLVPKQVRVLREKTKRLDPAVDIREIPGLIPDEGLDHGRGRRV